MLQVEASAKIRVPLGTALAEVQFCFVIVFNLYKLHCSSMLSTFIA